jgi:hypothetical protein
MKKITFFILTLAVSMAVANFANAEACTSWTFSEWGPCEFVGDFSAWAAGRQTRTVIAAFPEGCDNYTNASWDDLNRDCKYIPECTESDYICSDWSDCTSSGKQTRTCYVDNKANQWPYSGEFECEGGVPMPETTKSCDYVQPEIQSFSPIEGAVGDEVKIMLPYILDIFSDCYSTGIYATHELSARVYFNNVEAEFKKSN